MPKTGFAIVFYILSFGHLYSQVNFDTIFSKHPLLKKVSENADKYHLQIMYSRIQRQESGEVSFSLTNYNVRPENYFYCASLVKLPLSILALQKLNEIGVPQNAVMFTDSSRTCHFSVTKDTSSPNKLPSIEHYIKKMLLVSDNFAYSRVYEFLGVDYIHQNFRRLYYPNVRIINRYDGACTGKDNLVTNPVTFLNSDLKVIYRQKEQVPTEAYTPILKNIHVGKAYYTNNKKKVSAPKDFTFSNYLTLPDCYMMLLELIFNQDHSFNITEEQRKFLIAQLSLYPRQSNTPRYNPAEYYDSYKKYLFYGDSKAPITDTNLIITNIVGQSYGFMSDCAYFYDKKNNVEFILCAALYANEDEILNDGKYDYKTVALPFLAELGRQFYKYELRRKLQAKN